MWKTRENTKDRRFVRRMWIVGFAISGTGCSRSRTHDTLKRGRVRYSNFELSALRIQIEIIRPRIADRFYTDIETDTVRAIHELRDHQAVRQACLSRYEWRHSIRYKRTDEQQSVLRWILISVVRDLQTRYVSLEDQEWFNRGADMRWGEYFSFHAVWPR